MDINTQNISSFIEHPAHFLNSNFHSTSMSFLLSDVRKMISNMNEQLFQSIPLATNLEYPNKSLIRYRCIISDMLSPDFCYLKLPFMPNNNIDYPMELDVFSNVDDKNTLQRFKYCASLIPGLNRWVLDSWKSKGNDEFINQETNNKRSLQDETNPLKKHKSDLTQFNQIQSENVYESNTHQSKIKENINSTDEIVKCCLLYDYDLTNNFKMNEVIEVVGILDIYQTSEIQHTETTSDLFETFEFTSDEDAYPHTIVPRLHALYVKKLNSINPITNLPDLDSFTKIRHEILVIFSKILFGDEVAAEYLLSCLISRVYVRNEFSSIGGFPINFIGLPKLSIEEQQQYIQKLYNFISLLMPSSHFYSLTVKGLNSESLIPKRDSSDKMKPGRLQLADGTFLLIDESDLETGKLDAIGVRNVELLKSLLHFQKLKYNFEYYSIEMNTNVIALIISKGKSILGCMCPIMIKPNIDQSFQEIFNSLNEILTDNLLSLIRAYLYKVRLNEFSISDDLKTKIAEGFVQMRQDAKAKDQKMTVEDLHQMINLARLQSISYGYNELPNSLWLRTLYLEEERKKQLAS